MEKLEIIINNTTKKFELFINLNKSLSFDCLLDYLSYCHPKVDFCPCFQFIDSKKGQFIPKNEKVIDFRESNKNIFYIANTYNDQKCHCTKLFKFYYNKSKSEIVEYLIQMKKYNECMDELTNEIMQLKEDKKFLEMSIKDPELIDKLNKLGYIDYLMQEENLTKIDPNNNQIIVNESVNKKNLEEFYDVIIDIKSIKDINKGWEIKMTDKGKQNYEKYNKTKNIKIGVIGNSNKGKSFLLSKISKIDLPSGTSIRTEGLSIKYPDLKMYKDRKIILLDSAGLETPVLRDNKPSDDINKEEQNFNLLEEEDHIEKDDEDNEQKDEFKEKSREKLITELFLQNYIINNSDILIIVVGILTYSEQKLINKIKKLQNETKKGLNNYLFIIHNLITYTSVEQVEDYIKEYLLQSTTFSLEEGHNISIKTESKNGKYFYEKNTSSKIYHLIYANEGSEAGKKYNKFTLDFLEHSFQDITDLEPFDVIKTVKKRFIDLSSEIFERYDNNLTINDFANDNKYIKLINHNNLTLKKCFIDELGFSNLRSNGFEPKYNYYKKGDKLIIKIESPGNFKQLVASMDEFEGYNKIIKISGEKKNDKEPENKKDNIFNSREYGKYFIQCPITYDDTYILKNQKPEISDKNGIIFVEYHMEERIKEKQYEQKEEI